MGKETWKYRASSLRSWWFCGCLMNMEAVELGVVSQFFPSDSSRGFAARFRDSAAQTPTKPPAMQATEHQNTRYDTVDNW